MPYNIYIHIYIYPSKLCQKLCKNNVSGCWSFEIVCSNVILVVSPSFCSTCSRSRRSLLVERDLAEHFGAFIPRNDVHHVQNATFVFSSFPLPSERPFWIATG